MKEKEGKRKSRKAAIVIIGMTMFATQFGAGNVIFPTYLGQSTGTDWLIGFLAFMLMDVGLAAAAILSIVVNRKQDTYGVLGKIGKVPSKVMLTLIILCIGPCLAIPRTAATTYELGVHELFPELPLWAFGLIFFAIVLICSIKPSRVVDIVGNYLTPILLIFMLVLIVAGLVRPLGEPAKLEGINAFRDGIVNGYQTMDGLGGVLTGMIGISAMASYGYATKKEQLQVMSGSVPIAQMLLIIVYGGLTAVGATVSGLSEFSGLDQALLLVKITNSLLGSFAIYALGLIVLLACLTTAIGLTMVAGNHFEELSRGKISYKKVVWIIIAVSYLFSNFGLTKIISIAVPILSTLYPPVVVLVIMAFFDRKIKRDHIAAGAAYTALAYALCETLNTFGLPFGFVSKLPFSEVGLGWIVPAVIGGVIAAAIPGKRWDLTELQEHSGQQAE